MPPQGYDMKHEARRNQLIEQASQSSHKRGQDLEVGQARLILTSPNGTRYNVTVNDLGMLTATAV